MRSIERMLEYTRLPSEPPRCSDGAPRPPPGWPSAAWLEFERVSACYRPGLPPVLQDLSFAVPVRGGLCLPPDHVLLKPVILCLINYGVLRCQTCCALQREHLASTRFCATEAQCAGPHRTWVCSMLVWHLHPCQTRGCFQASLAERIAQHLKGVHSPSSSSERG